MKRNISKLLAVVVMLALVMTMAAVAASAVTVPYTAISGTTTNFTKYLVIKEGSKIPALTFTYGIRAGADVPATSDETFDVFAGVDSNKITIGSAAFTDGENAETIEGVTGTNQIAAQKDVTIDFSQVEFKKPGVYRYIVTENETNGAAGVTYDTKADNSKVRYLDVYVIDDNGTLTVQEYVLHKSIDEAFALDKKTGESKELGDKSDGYVNEVSSVDLEFGKEVTGNQGDKEKEFTFTLEISGANPNTTYEVNLSNADNEAGVKSFKTDASGTATVTYNLSDGQYVRVIGLPTGYGYTLSEDEGVYTKTEGISAAVNGTTAYEDAVSGSNITKDIKTGFTNNRQGTIPTGVLLTIAPFAIGLLLFGAIILVVISKRRREAEAY